MKIMVKVKIDNGYYIFKLDDLLNSRNISINKLIRDNNKDFKVIKRIMTGDLVKLDIFVLARFCNYFKCDMNDIVEYIRE